MHTTDETPTEAYTEERIGTDTKMRKNKKVRVEEKWPKGLYCALFFTHRLFLDFGSLLHPLAGRRTGGQALGRDKVGGYGSTKTTGEEEQEGKEEEEIKKVNKRREDSKSPKPNGGCRCFQSECGGGGRGGENGRQRCEVCVSVKPAFARPCWLSDTNQNSNYEVE